MSATTIQRAQEYTSFRVGEFARAIINQPVGDPPDKRKLEDKELGFPQRSWQKDGLPKHIQDELGVIAKSLNSAFQDIRERRTLFTHGKASEMPILTPAQIENLQKTIATQLDAIEKLGITPEQRKTYHLENVSNALRTMSTELDTATRLRTSPQSVPDVEARAHAHGRILEIGQEQARRTQERNTAAVARGETPPKWDATLPPELEAERRHYAHPLNERGEASATVIRYGVRVNPTPSQERQGAGTNHGSESHSHAQAGVAAPTAHGRPRIPHAPGIVAPVVVAGVAGAIALATGSTAPQAARVTAETLASNAPVVDVLLAPNANEARVRSQVNATTAAITVVGAAAGAAVGAPALGVGAVPGAAVGGVVTNLAGGYTVDEYYRLLARYGRNQRDVDPGTGEQLFAASMTRVNPLSIAVAIVGVVNNQVQAAAASIMHGDLSSAKGVDEQLTAQLSEMNKKGWGKVLGDKDGQLTLAEIKAAFPKGFDFKSMDKDGNGKISGKEITDAIAAQQTPPTAVAAASQRPQGR